MKKVSRVLVAAALVVGFTAVSQANDNAPLALTDAQMAQIVAGEAQAHQASAAELKGAVADLMPAHVVGDQPGEAHQSGASSLKGGVADLVPGHVRMNP